MTTNIDAVWIYGFEHTDSLYNAPVRHADLQSQTEGEAVPQTVPEWGSLPVPAEQAGEGVEGVGGEDGGPQAQHRVRRPARDLHQEQQPAHLARSC